MFLSISFAGRQFGLRLPSVRIRAGLQVGHKRPRAARARTRLRRGESRLATRSDGHFRRRRRARRCLGVLVCLSAQHSQRRRAAAAAAARARVRSVPRAPQ